MIYIFKTVLIFIDNKEPFRKFSKKIKVPEMVASVLFLASGLWLLYENGWSLPRWMLEKLSLVFISIPLAIIGTKKENKWLLMIAVLCIIGSMAMALNYGRPLTSSSKTVVLPEEEDPTYDINKHGLDIYSANCINCHGADGKLGFSGAHDLSSSQLGLNERFQIIKFGKNSMQPFEKRLDDMEIRAVATYIEKLRAISNLPK
jgi:mono/diheme cytochrome c family protein